MTRRCALSWRCDRKLEGAGVVPRPEGAFPSLAPRSTAASGLAKFEQTSCGQLASSFWTSVLQGKFGLPFVLRSRARPSLLSYRSNSHSERSRSVSSSSGLTEWIAKPRNAARRIACGYATHQLFFVFGGGRFRSSIVSRESETFILSDGTQRVRRTHSTDL